MCAGAHSIDMMGTKLGQRLMTDADIAKPTSIFGNLCRFKFIPMYEELAKMDQCLIIACSVRLIIIRSIQYVLKIKSLGDQNTHQEMKGYFVDYPNYVSPYTDFLIK